MNDIPIPLINDFLKVSEVCVATDSEIRVSALLLSLMIRNLKRRCFGVLQMYDVIYRDIRSAGSTDEASRQTDSTVI